MAALPDGSYMSDRS